MDITTILGLIGGVGLLAGAVASGQISAVFLNVPGLLLVLGGTAVALLINTPWDLLLESGLALRKLFLSGKSHPREVVLALTAVSRMVHQRGVAALQNVSQDAGEGFVARAAQVALEFKNPDYVAEVLDREISQWMDRKNEVVNVYRTLSVLAPMFGLIGTLVGIIEVLRHIADPEQVGASMAIAVTTAFYGIVLANLVAVPLAGKIRLRYREEYVMRRAAAEGIVQVLKGTVPAVLERRLEAFLVG